VGNGDTLKRKRLTPNKIRSDRLKAAKAAKSAAEIASKGETERRLSEKSGDEGKGQEPAKGVGNGESPEEPGKLSPNQKRRAKIKAAKAVKEASEIENKGKTERRLSEKSGGERKGQEPVKGVGNGESPEEPGKLSQNQKKRAKLKAAKAVKEASEIENKGEAERRLRENNSNERKGQEPAKGVGNGDTLKRKRLTPNKIRSDRLKAAKAAKSAAEIASKGETERRLSEKSGDEGKGQEPAKGVGNGESPEEPGKLSPNQKRRAKIKAAKADAEIANIGEGKQANGTGKRDQIVRPKEQKKNSLSKKSKSSANNLKHISVSPFGDLGNGEGFSLAEFQASPPAKVPIGNAQVDPIKHDELDMKDEREHEELDVKDERDVDDLLHSLQDNPANVKDIVKTVKQAARDIFQDNKVEVHPIGSAGSGLGSYESDIDLTVEHREMGEITSNAKKKHAQDFLRKLNKVLGSQKYGWRCIQFIPTARVPVLKMKEKKNGSEVDITYNNLLPIHNTRLLKLYVDKFRPLGNLIRLVRHWAKCSNIHGAQKGYFSSYSWALMCIFFVQIQYEMPSLQALAKRKKMFLLVDGIETNIAFDANGENFWINDEQRVQNLFVEFLRFYSVVFEADHVASIRIGRLLHWNSPEYAELHFPYPDALTINLEDPFDYTAKGNMIGRRNLAVTLWRPEVITNAIWKAWKKISTQSPRQIMSLMANN